MDPRVGDTVDVPGGMYGTVKFVGEVAGKKGKFAGVQLAPEYAIRGKNNGDVDGRHYFKTTKAGSGIFLPVDKATRRGPATPTTPSLATFNQGGRTPALPKPNFSQSIGPGARAASPALKPTMRRPSLQRPGSPLRNTPAKAAPKLSTPGSRPSLAPGTKNKVGMGSRYGQSTSARPSNFGASLRGPSATPSRTPLGPEPSFDEESDSTPTPTPAPAKTIDHTMKDGEIKRLKEGLESKDRQLKEQAATLSDMEKSLSELQSLLPPDYESLDHKRDAIVESEDVVQMRSVVRDKNEKIQMLIAEFDAHRADFRSTIDTLEMASTETERVYEKRVEELLQEVRELQYRGEDVETVAQQLRQLEDLVQELEEGLEDARRGEAEARGEVEFLRGEVERGRSELKREKNKAATAREDSGLDGSNDISMRDLEAKDDEIRGLKAIIHSLSGNDDTGPGTKKNGHVNSLSHTENDEQTVKLEQRLKQLEALLEKKSSREEELESELERLRTSSTADKHKSSNTTTSHRLSDRTIVPGDWREQKGPPPPSQLETMHEADARSTATDSSALWCEICETGGHDILTCTNVFAGQQQQQQQHDIPASPSKSTSKSTPLSSDDPEAPHPLLPPQRKSQDEADRVAPLKQRTNPDSITSPPLTAIKQLTDAFPPSASSAKPPNPNDLGMVAGKSSGVIDEQKWCALCERDGHESVDCPFEDAF
jgi:CAP-Gly domain/CLIP1 zinc knuckle